jgi:hypothetical protein
MVNKHLRLRVLCRSLCLCVLLHGGLAAADKVDGLIAQLADSKDYKVRLSAALNLAKIGDKRAVPGFLGALRDSDKTVRGVAAAALGKLVDSSTPDQLRNRALSALKEVAARDSNAFVRNQAETAYNVLRRLAGSSPDGAMVYVNIGKMASKSADSGSMVPLMRRTAESTFRKRARSMAVDWPGGRPPSESDLRKRNARAFHVDGTLTELATQSRGSAMLVSCNISMLIATYPDKSMFGFLSGGAKVEAGNSPKEIEYAKEDCITAVVEDLVARKVIPTIESRSK